MALLGLLNALNSYLAYVVIAIIYENICIDRQTDRQTDICSNVFDSNVDLDVSLAHPWCSDIISKAAWQDGAAALRREEKKIEKYQKETRPGGFSPNLIPLVFEHYGRWGTEAEKFLNKISHRSRDEDSKSNTADFKTYWRRLFSVTLQNCNSSVIQRKIDHLTLGSSLLCALYQEQSHLH